MPSLLKRSRRLSGHSRQSSSISKQQQKEDATATESPATNGGTAKHTSTGSESTATPSKQIQPTPPPNGSNRGTSTIRTVPSFEEPSEASSPRDSGFSSSVRSNTSATSSHTSQPPQQNPIPPTTPSDRLKPQPTRPEGLSRSRSVNSQMSSSDAAVRADGLTESNSAFSLQVPDATSQEQGAREGSPGWNGAVGKAGLGKTGRVIDKLVSDNESLKRDLKIEKLKSDEYKQAAKLIEDKMDRTVSEYESRLLEANVTKTLLSRKERQVESLQDAVELEKKRTSDAQEREAIWRNEMEKSRRETKVQVEEAVTQAALMEGRYNAISSHWRDQGDEVKRAMEKMNRRIEELNQERKNDDDKIVTLRDLCDQQDGNIRDLKKQRDEISQQFEEYKRQQDEMLQDIKKHAREREEEQARTIEQTKEALGTLRWALNVKKNVKGAG